MNLTQEEQDEMEAAEKALTPPAYVPTALEEERAKAKLWVENIMSTMIWDYRNADDPEKFKRVNQYADKYYWNLPDEVELPWDHPDNLKQFEYYKDGLSSMHWGSCTAYAGSCDRCDAEALFNIPYTASAAKSVNSKLLHTWLRLRAKSEGDEMEYYRIWQPHKYKEMINMNKL